jgi:hypothetical protein
VIRPRILGCERAHALTPQNTAFFTPKGTGAGRQISENLRCAVYAVPVELSQAVGSDGDTRERFSMSWKILEEQHPELATFGAERLNGNVAYLATIRKDGSPRVHPMTPIIGQGHLFVFMEPTSPKGHDIRRDGRYAIHCSMSDASGVSGEFSISGRAHLVNNSELRALAASLANYTIVERYILFEFDIVSAASTIYPEDKPLRRFWKRDK